MGTISRQYSFVAGAVPSAANWNADPNNFITLVNGQLDENNVDHSSSDGIATLQNTQTLSGAKTFSSSSGTAFNYGVTINEGSNDSDTRIETNNMTHAVVVDAGLDAISFGAAAVDDSFVQIAKGATTSAATQNTYHLSVAPGGATTIPSGTTAYVGSVNIAEPNITATGTVTNAFTVRIAGAPTEGSTTNYALWVDAGATQLDGALSVGVDGTGADVTFYGDTSGKQALWDQSEDTLQLNDNTNLTFGTGADADIFYDGTDLNISPAVVGSGDIVVNGASIEFADSEGVTFGTGKDATIKWDATNLAIAAGSADVKITASNVIPATNDGSALGVSGTAWADLFLASGSHVDFNAGDVTIAHASNLLTLNGGDLHVANGHGMVIGHTAQVTVGTIVPELQVLGTSFADSWATLGRFSADALGPNLAFVKSRSAIGSFTNNMQDGDNVGRLRYFLDDGTDYGSEVAEMLVEVDGTPGPNDTPGRFVFKTTADGAASPTEHMKLASDGRLFLTKSAGGTNMIITNSASGGDTPYGIAVDFSAASPDNSSAYYLYFEDSTTARFRVNSDGDVLNHDGTYGTISDVKFKEQITSSRSYWDDFKALQYKKWKDKSDVEAKGVDAPYRLGLVAQDVEAIFPSCVPESPESEKYEVDVPAVTEDREITPAVLDEEGVEITPAVIETVELEPATTKTEKRQSETETYKWVKSSIIEGPIMAKVVQELQARVEALES